MLLAGACSSSDDAPLADAKPVVDNYIAIVHASYDDTLREAQTLKTRIDALVAAPDAASLEAAKQQWLAAREPYALTESYRFYDGPIDDPDDGPEPRINAWPLDEVYIDYVEGDPDAGIINHPVEFPTLTKELLAAQNEKGGEKNIATGYHAIEFLLWGQDRSATGPGARPHTDYVVGGTAANQDRRATYLALVGELLVDDLSSVAVQWVPGESYAAELAALPPEEAIRRMLQGLGALSGAELSGERMATALDNRDQEDEHSCFSDNTHRDLLNNATAIQNVYLGRYGSMDGPGLDELVRARDPELDARMQDQLAASIAAIQAIPVPFDQAIMNDDGRAKILAAVRALRDQTDTIVDVATLLDITINLE
ncbi:MAG TPA: imelysin family protein [Kofleriaceae bacterium]|nr:imelysin family protein [Kofleriaceae bacterium]